MLVQDMQDVPAAQIELRSRRNRKLTPGTTCPDLCRLADGDQPPKDVYQRGVAQVGVVREEPGGAACQLSDRPADASSDHPPLDSFRLPVIQVPSS